MVHVEDEKEHDHHDLEKFRNKRMLATHPENRTLLSTII